MNDASSHTPAPEASASFAPPGRRELIAIALIVIMGITASALVINARVLLQDYGQTLHTYHAAGSEIIRYTAFLIDSNARGWSNDSMTEFITSRIRERIQTGDELSQRALWQLDKLNHPITRRLASISESEINFLRGDSDLRQIYALARKITQSKIEQVPEILKSVDPNLAIAIRYGDALTEFRYRLNKVDYLSIRSSRPLIALLLSIGVAVLFGILLVWVRALRPAIVQLQKTNQALADTSQTLMEQNLALERSELESRAAQRIAKFGYWIANKHGEISGSEGLAHVLGMEAARLPKTLAEMAAIGHSGVQLCQSEDTDILTGYLDLQSKDGAREFMRVIDEKGGEERIIRERVESLREPHTGLRYMIGIMINVSELAHAQVRIARAEKLDSIGVLTGFIAHDVNNVLAIIRGSIDLLEIFPKSIDKRLEAMRRAVDSAAGLINRLSTLSKGEPDEEELFDPRISLRSCVDLFQTNASTSMGVELDIDDASSSIAHMNRGQFENAILNLLINAREALEGRSNGTVLITCRTVENPKVEGKNGPRLTGKFICIEVTDNGCGMNPYALRRSFDPFYSTKTHHTTRPRGLGLWSVYQLIKNSGGELSITSKENRGTTVTIHLPIYAHGSDTKETGAPMLLASNGRIDAGVLIVDDKRDLLDVLDQQLNMLGYDTWTATNISDAMDVLERQPEIGVIVSDINLQQGETGLQLARHIRGSKADKAIVFISGYLSGAQTGSEFQDIAVVRKPIDIHLLDEEMQRALHSTKIPVSQLH